LADQMTMRQSGRPEEERSNGTERGSRVQIPGYSRESRQVGLLSRSISECELKGYLNGVVIQEYRAKSTVYVQLRVLPGLFGSSIHTPRHSEAHIDIMYLSSSSKRVIGLEDWTS
jgi:hypothetical protein